MYGNGKNQQSVSATREQLFEMAVTKLTGLTRGTCFWWMFSLGYAITYSYSRIHWFHVKVTRMHLLVPVTY